MDEARRVEQELCRRKTPRWPLLKNQEELTPKQAETLRAIYRRPVPVGQRAAAGFLPCPTPAQARTLLDRLLFFLQHAEDAELVRWGRTLRSWKAELWSYHQHRVTSAHTEGIHTKIKLLKRLSYWFRNRHMYVRKIVPGFVPLALVLSAPHLLN